MKGDIQKLELKVGGRPVGQFTKFFKLRTFSKVQTEELLVITDYLGFSFSNEKTVLFFEVVCLFRTTRAGIFPRSSL
jgi:hypothetical protein